MLNGFINLYKPSGITSNRALGILKYSLKQNNVITKLGHFGTLDPIAEGVLPIALGRATRLFSYSLEKKKEYIATFLFGTETDTLDISGAVLRKDNVIVTRADILPVLSRLTGAYPQYPPIFSAKSVGGVKAYKLARRGETVELNPKVVEIFSFELLEELGENIFSFRIRCSAGTYIRALARDLAAELGTVGIMTALIREQSGIFHAETAVSLSELEENPLPHILPMECSLADFPKVRIPDSLEKQVRNGVPVEAPFLPDCSVSVWVNDELLGIGERDEEGCLRMKTWLL